MGLLLELLDGFLRACGESRKLVPHAASWRGQSCALSATVDNQSGTSLLPPADEASVTGEAPIVGRARRAAASREEAAARIVGQPRRAAAHCHPCSRRSRRSSAAAAVLPLQWTLSVAAAEARRMTIFCRVG